jgi:archaellum biogenesis protein FlaJ (TadC family)
MKIIDWLFVTIYHGTLNRGSRTTRAHFGLWFSSSFVWVGIVYLVLTLFKIRIGKPLFMPIFILVFTVNYFLLYYIYIKMNRSKLVIDTGKEVTKGYALFAKFFVFLAIFFSIAIMLAMTIYYGKNVGFL